MTIAFTACVNARVTHLKKNTTAAVFVLIVLVQN